MKIPRDVNGADLVRALRVLGYTVSRQTGSHIRVTTALDGEHHEAIPNHRPIKLGTLRGILRGIASHHRMSLDELLSKLAW
jgi:predicted RNA binding protein YcfA (HicA-like mRNA interferase family)